MFGFIEVLLCWLCVCFYPDLRFAMSYEVICYLHKALCRQVVPDNIAVIVASIVWSCVCAAWLARGPRISAHSCSMLNEVICYRCKVHCRQTVRENEGLTPPQLDGIIIATNHAAMLVKQRQYWTCICVPADTINLPSCQIVWLFHTQQSALYTCCLGLQEFVA